MSLSVTKSSGFEGGKSLPVRISQYAEGAINIITGTILAGFGEGGAMPGETLMAFGGTEYRRT
ncbi:hypothetical protein KCP70_14820 [Salmonella enterica subsp. enterica]|nr:hypothetical protein KCP70_14820 [Salmonella enterica subsp. enterica]